MLVLPASRERMHAIVARLREMDPPVPPVAIAWALAGASACDTWHRENERIELVWTGPATLSQGVYRTHQTLLDVIAFVPAGSGPERVTAGKLETSTEPMLLLPVGSGPERLTPRQRRDEAHGHRVGGRDGGGRPVGAGLHPGAEDVDAEDLIGGRGGPPSLA